MAKPISPADVKMDHPSEGVLRARRAAWLAAHPDAGTRNGLTYGGSATLVDLRKRVGSGRVPAEASKTITHGQARNY